MSYASAIKSIKIEQNDHKNEYESVSLNPRTSVRNTLEMIWADPLI